MSDSQNWMTNCCCREWLLKNKAANALTTLEKIVMVMIKSNITSAKISHTKGTCSCAWRWENVFTTTNKYKYMRDNNIVNNVMGITNCYLKYSQTWTHKLPYLGPLGTLNYVTMWPVVIKLKLPHNYISSQKTKCKWLISLLSLLHHIC